MPATPPEDAEPDSDAGLDPDEAMVHHHRDVQGGAVRAAVFGVSDGLVSNVALILGVAATDLGADTVVAAGVSGLLAGAASMAAGEYVSVKAQSELVERELAIERRSLAEDPEAEEEELVAIYRSRGVPARHARTVARAVMADPEVALEVHAREELGVDPDETGDPVRAAAASFVAFALGAVVPLVPWLVGSGTAALLVSMLAAIVAIVGVGYTLAVFTERSRGRTVTRQLAWATGACAITYAIGTALGAGFG